VHGHHHFGDRAERAFWHMARKFGGRGGFGPFGHGPGGHGMRGGHGGPADFLRAGRMLGDGDLKLITLALMSETPRHGYDIIKALEDVSSGFYVPSPGVVYPTLTFLEEAGYAVSAAEGNKKVFSITEGGRAHLEENRETVERVLDHLERLGRKMAKAREWFGSNEEEEGMGRHGRRGHGKHGQFRAVRRRLRAALAELVERPEKQDEALAILENAAQALEALSRD
jgi:DNA-binding PadR family transcriptional regulator